MKNGNFSFMFSRLNRQSDALMFLAVVWKELLVLGFSVLLMYAVVGILVLLLYIVVGFSLLSLLMFDTPFDVVLV